MATKRKEEWEKIQRKGMKYKTKIKNNTYNLLGEYGIGFIVNTNYEFYFDLEDYDKIKDKYWYVNKQGYVVHRDKDNSRNIFLHNFIIDKEVDKLTVTDHINRVRHDNRRENLRIATNTQNNMNMKTYQKTLDKSGVKGVTWDKNSNRWQAHIRVNRKLIKLGAFKKECLEKAIICRLKAEKKYFGEFASLIQQELFIKYNIN